MEHCPTCGHKIGPDMHIVEITALGASCSCGFTYESLTGSEAQWVGARHARYNAPALVRDLRFVTKED